MGVYIKGMKMPQGESCVTVRIWGDGRVIGVHNDSLVKHAIELPPHGDLIDLKAPFKAQYYDEMTEEWTEKAVTVEEALYGCMVDEMPPTIIPAEKAEEGET